MHGLEFQKLGDTGIEPASRGGEGDKTVTRVLNKPKSGFTELD